MWQYYVVMALVLLAFILNISNKGKSIEVKELSPTESVIGLLVGSLMTWLIWSFLSVNWMWLSTGLMAVTLLSLARLTYYCAILRKRVDDKSSYGTFICLVQGVAYTIFYFKYVA